MGRILAGLAVAAGFLAAMIFALQREAAVECEVCMQFGGRTACRTASAAGRDTALRGAVSTACAVLADGVTRGIQCDNTPPRSVSCSD